MITARFNHKTVLARHKTAEPFRALFVRWSWLILGAAGALQCILFCTITNVLAVACVLLAWLVVSSIFLRSGLLYVFPLSIFLILGFTATQFCFPMVFTLLEGKPLIYNLLLPEQVFFHSLAALLALLAGHAVYRHLAQSGRYRTSSGLAKAGFFSPPSDLQLWLMGFLGVLATAYVLFVSQETGMKISGSAVSKAFQSIMPFSYAPYFIPLGQLYGNDKDKSKKLVPQLLLFTIVLLLLSMGRNSRGSFMLGFTSLGLAYGIGLLMGIFKTQIFSIKTVLIGVACVLLVTGPLADLGTAMVIVRGQRNGISTTELMEHTFQAFGDKAAIAARRAADKLEENDWDERYLDNVFTARFANLKFNDISLVQASKISPQDPAMLNYSIDYVLGGMPTPILNALQVNIDKEAVYSVSIGDYLFLKAGGGTEALGGFRTGHFAGTGMAAFGWWYLLWLFVGIMPVYYLFDRFFIAQYRRSGANGPVPRFSLCGLLVITTIFQFLPAESVVVTATFLLRGWVQLVLLYFLLYHFTRLISAALSRERTNPSLYL